MGKGKGNKNSSKINSKRGSSTAFFETESFNLEYDFDLYTLQDDGQTPTTFAGALENFNGSLTHSSIFDPTPPVFDFFQDDFDAGREQRIDFMSETSDLQASFDETNNRLEYQVINNEQLTALGVTELSFYIKDADDAEGFQNSLGKEIDLDLATASNGRSESEAIEYIVSEDLFDFDGAIISGQAAEGSDEAGQIITREEIFPDGTGSEVISVDVANDPANTQDDTPTPATDEPVVEDPVIGKPPTEDPVIDEEGGDVVRESNDDNPLNRTISNDTLSGATGDSVNLDGENDDLLNSETSNDTLSGGADIFVVDAMNGTEIISDFDYGQDLIGLSGDITFDQLTFTQEDGAAIVSYQGREIASISGVTPEQITANLCTEF